MALRNLTPVSGLPPFPPFPSNRDALGGQGWDQFLSEPNPVPDTQGLLSRRQPNEWGACECNVNVSAPYFSSHTACIRALCALETIPAPLPLVYDQLMTLQTSIHVSLARRKPPFLTGQTLSLAPSTDLLHWLGDCCTNSSLPCSTVTPRGQHCPRSPFYAQSLALCVVDGRHSVSICEVSERDKSEQVHRWLRK